MRPETKRVLAHTPSLEKLTDEMLTDQVFEENQFSPRLCDVLVFAYLIGKRNIPKRVVTAMCWGEDRSETRDLIIQSVEAWNSSNDESKEKTQRITRFSLTALICNDMDATFRERRVNSLGIAMELYAEAMVDVALT